MDAEHALADLTEISSQIDRVAILELDGSIDASNLGGDEPARRFAAAAKRLADEADRVRDSRGLPPVAQLEAATLDGSVFLVRDGRRMIAATTKPDPTVGLVFYDLKHCLRRIAEPEPEPKPEPGAEPEVEAEAEPEAGAKPKRRAAPSKSAASKSPASKSPASKSAASKSEMPKEADSSP